MFQSENLSKQPKAALVSYKQAHPTESTTFDHFVSTLNNKELSDLMTFDEVAELSCPLTGLISFIDNEKPEEGSAESVFLATVKKCMAEPNGVASLDVQNPDSWMLDAIIPDTTPGPIHLTVNVSDGPETLDWVINAVEKIKTVRELEIQSDNDANLDSDFLRLYEKLKLHFIQETEGTLELLRFEYAGDNSFIRIDSELSMVQTSSYRCMETLGNFGRIEIDLEGVTDLTSEKILEVGDVISRNAKKFEIILIAAKNVLEVFKLISHAHEVPLKIVCALGLGRSATIFVNGSEARVNLNVIELLKYIPKHIESLLLHSNLPKLSEEDWEYLHGLENLKKLRIYSCRIDETRNQHLTRWYKSNNFASQFLGALIPEQHYPKLQYLQIERLDIPDMKFYIKPIEMKSLEEFNISKVKDTEQGTGIIEQFKPFDISNSWTFGHKGIKVIITKDPPKSIDVSSIPNEIPDGSTN